MKYLFLVLLLISCADSNVIKKKEYNNNSIVFQFYKDTDGEKMIEQIELEFLNNNDKIGVIKDTLKRDFSAIGIDIDFDSIDNKYSGTIYLTLLGNKSYIKGFEDHILKSKSYIYNDLYFDRGPTSDFLFPIEFSLINNNIHNFNISLLPNNTLIKNDSFFYLEKFANLNSGNKIALKILYPE